MIQHGQIRLPARRNSRERLGDDLPVTKWGHGWKGQSGCFNYGRPSPYPSLFWWQLVHSFFHRCSSRTFAVFLTVICHSWLFGHQGGSFEEREAMLAAMPPHFGSLHKRPSGGGTTSFQAQEGSYRLASTPGGRRTMQRLATACVQDPCHITILPSANGPSRKPCMIL